MKKTTLIRIVEESDVKCIKQFMFRVLYVDQFTEFSREESAEPFFPQNIQNVFEHYQPKVKVLLKNDDGNIEYESIVFNHIEDFDDELLVTQIKNLPCKSLYLNENLHNVRLAIRQLEIAYRTLDSFFQLAGDCDRQVITLMNINKDDLYEEDSVGFYDVCRELERNYDRLRLEGCYSLLVIPGYLLDAHVIRMWAKKAYNYKVLLITDFKCCSNIQMLKEEIEYADLQSPDDYMTNIVMTCNSSLGRKKSKIADECEDLFLPASAVLAGRLRCIYKELGTHSNVQNEIVINSLLLKDEDELLLNLCEQDLVYLEQKGLVPIYQENNHIMTISCRTLYNGSTKELTSFPIVLSIDCITILIGFCVFEIACEIWDPIYSKQRLSELIFDNSRIFNSLYHRIEIKNIDKNPITRDLEIEVWVENVQSPHWISVLLCFNGCNCGVYLNKVTIKQASIE